MKILGLSVFDDSSSSIIKDGSIIYAIEEERINRVKHYSGIPYLAVDECLNQSGNRFSDLDYIAIGWNPYIGWLTRISKSLKYLITNGKTGNSKLKRGGNYIKGCLDIVKLKDTFEKKYNFNEKIPPLKFVNHHNAHAASAYFTSNYDDCNIIVADGVGESDSISLFKAKKGKITKISSIKYPVSLGHLYAAITGFLGFKMTSDEGKVMALASYGEDNFKEVFEEIFKLGNGKNRNSFNINLLDYHSARNGVFSKAWTEMVGIPARMKNDPLNKIHFDLACSLQNHVERCVLKLLKKYFPDGSGKPLCAAGGFFLNSVLNGKIVNEFTKDFYVFPAAGDNGVSVGAALYVNSKYDNIKKNKIEDAYFGSCYGDDEIEKAVNKSGLIAVKYKDVFAETASLLGKGKILGWYNGRMEFGPRALGNRSILADPKFEWMKDLVNSKVKHREYFRPFAAAVLLEEADNYFEDLSESPFMLKVFKMKKEYKEIFPAICHVDGTCRVQTVSKENNPVFYNLLINIKRKSGYGIILNTSMNDVGEPIINTPSEALNLFKSTNLDVMVVGDYILKKA